MDDIHGAATPSERKQFINDLSREIEVKGGDGCGWGKPHEHLNRPRIPMTDEDTNTTQHKASGICCTPIGTDGCEDTADSWCIDTSCDHRCYTFTDS